MCNTKLLLVGLLALSACSTIKAPKGQVPRRQDLVNDAFGGWMLLTLTSQQKVEGELLALTADSIHIINQTRFSFAKTEIVSGRLIMYITDTQRFGRWATAGTFGSITNGWFLIFTMPIWIITGIATKSSEANRINYLDYPPTDWNYLNRYARFPQGFPAGLNRSEVMPRPLEKK